MSSYPDPFAWKLLLNPWSFIREDSCQQRTTRYEGASPEYILRQTGSKLMSDGITLDKIAAGELIFFNLSDYPGSGTDHVPPSPPSKVEKRLGTNLGVQGIELSWSPGTDDHWISYYEVLKNGKLIGKAAIGTFFFDHSDSARNEINAVFEIRTVDGDGNRSQAVTRAARSEANYKTYEALGDFSPTQSGKQWRYEETLEDGSYRDLLWDNGGYEGRWTGSGLGRIGRIWMQPSAHYDLSRTFIVPAEGDGERVGRYPQRSQRGKSGPGLCTNPAQFEAGVADGRMGGS